MARFTEQDRQIAWVVGIETLVLIPIVALTSHRIDLSWTDNALKKPFALQGTLPLGLKRGSAPYLTTTHIGWSPRIHRVRTDLFE